MITRFYYSLTKEQPQVISLYALNEFSMRMSDSGILHTFNRYYPIAKEFGINWLIGQLTSTGTGEEDTDITKKLLEHIWLNLYDKNVGYVDVVHPRWEHPEKPFDSDDYLEMRQELGNSIWSIYIDTKDRYETLIEIYEDELSNLMGPITTSVSNNSTTTASGNNETRFNDVPQNALANGTYADDNFATNVTSAESGSTVGVIGSSTTQNDGMSKMARINEIQNMLKNLYADWAFEFNKLIVGE